MDKAAHDALWQEIARIWFGGKVARPHAKRVGKLVNDFADLEATPEEICRRLSNYKAAWRDVECTPEALVKHWCRFEKSAGQASSECAARNFAAWSKREREHDEQVMREREEAKRDIQVTLIKDDVPVQEQREIIGRIRKQA